MFVRALTDHTVDYERLVPPKIGRVCDQICNIEGPKVNCVAQVDFGGRAIVHRVGTELSHGAAETSVFRGSGNATLNKDTVLSHTKSF